MRLAEAEGRGPGCLLRLPEENPRGAKLRPERVLKDEVLIIRAENLRRHRSALLRCLSAEEALIIDVLLSRELSRVQHQPRGREA